MATSIGQGWKWRGGNQSGGGGVYAVIVALRGTICKYLHKNRNNPKSGMDFTPQKKKKKSKPYFRRKVVNKIRTEVNKRDYKVNINIIK